MTDSLTNLIWDLRELAFEGFSRGWDKLDQKDKHAEIDRVIEGIKDIQRAGVWEIASLLSRCSPDELAAFGVIARKVMGQGRESYGPTILANDARNFRREAADEITDAIWYWALDEVQRQMVPEAPLLNAELEGKR